MEPDGDVPRCGNHSHDPRIVATRSGAHLARQEEQKRRAELIRRAEAQGLIEIRPHRGGKGDKPSKAAWKSLVDAAKGAGIAVEVFVDAPADDALAWLGDGGGDGDGDGDGGLTRQRRRAPLILDGEKLDDASTRMEVLRRVVEAVGSGSLAAGQANAVNSAVRTAQKEKPLGSSRPVVVRMGVVSTRSEAEAVEAGELGLTDAREVH